MAVADTSYVTNTSNLSLLNGTGKATGTAVAGSTSAADQAGTALSKDYNNFLTLLTTQLKNQDPTQPMDTNQMTQQLATFASVEQQVATNKNMEKLVSLFSGGQLDQMVGYIGKTVEGEGGQAELKAATGAYFSYQVPDGANSVVLSVLDSNGNAVFNAQGDKTSGRHGIVWDGTNNFTNQKMADGVYQLSVTALDSTGAAVAGSKVYTSGAVTAVTTDAANGSVLKLGNISMKLSDVQSVRDTTTVPTTADQAANS